MLTLHWRHNGRDGVSNHQPHRCLFNRLFRPRSKKTSKLRVTGFCGGNSLLTGEFPAQRPVTRKILPFHDIIMKCTMLLCGGMHSLNKSTPPPPPPPPPQSDIQKVNRNHTCVRSRFYITVTSHERLCLKSAASRLFQQQISQANNKETLNATSLALCNGNAVSVLMSSRPHNLQMIITWWRHQMETFSALLALCAGNSPVTGEFPSQRPVTRSFDVFFHLCLNKQLSKQTWGWRFEPPSRPLWRHCNVSRKFYGYV